MATEKEIFEAADMIVAEGGNPTLAAVRERVGGGSYTSISAAMQKWRAARAEQEPTARAEEVPDVLAQHIREWWRGALAMAREDLQTERDALATERREIERQRAEAAELADQLAADLDEARAQIVRLEGADKRLALAMDEIHELGRSLLDARVRAERAEQQAQEVEQHRRAVESARVAEQAAQARLESAARELEELRQRAQRMEATTGRAIEKAAELRGRVMELERALYNSGKAEDGQGLACLAEPEPLALEPMPKPEPKRRKASGRAGQGQGERGAVG